MADEQTTILCKAGLHDSCQHKAAIFHPNGLLDCLCECHYSKENPSEDWHLCDGGFCYACNHGSRAVLTDG